MSGYIGPLPVPQGIQRKQSFTATASQTTFNTNGYTDGNFINVYLNGVRLINGTDYTATNGSDIVLTTGASASDVLDFETFDTFELVNQTFDNVTLKNPTHEDTDGGRESAVSFKGEQSGGEISTLAQIQASHDGTSDDQKGDLIFKTNDGSDNDAPTERARFDSSGNLLVGQSTSTAPASGNVVGNAISPLGYVSTNRDGGVSAEFGRKTSDGDIVVFRKDGTEVGNIGSISGVVSSIVLDPRSSSAKGAGIAGGSIDANTGIINPTDNTGAVTDDAIDLGSTSVRWQNLFLSGGAYLGGTVAANKLDEYEEGTWTPAFTNGGTITTINSATYTRIGRLVMAGFYISNPSGIPNNSSIFFIEGLPYNVSGGGAYQAGGGISYVNGANWASTNAFNTPLAKINSDQFYFHRDDGNTGALANSAALVLNAQEMICSIIYQTDA